MSTRGAYSSLQLATTSRAKTDIHQSLAATSDTPPIISFCVAIAAAGAAAACANASQNCQTGSRIRFQAATACLWLPELKCI